MAILLGLDSVSHEWPGKRVLIEQTIGIEAGDRIGIVGKNGDGKSSLLEIIEGQVEPDKGGVIRRNSITVGALNQSDELDPDKSVQFNLFGGVPEYEWASDSRIRSILGALLEGVELTDKVAELSGGQRRRVDLARVLCGSWDVLLLDEPTNHLDMRAIGWLAGHLKHRWPEGEGALLCVTHDRWFLDEVCTSMWEVHDGLIEPFEGGYSAYIQQRVERERQAAVAEEKRQNMLRKELAWLARGAQARSTKPKFRVKEARELVANDPPVRNSLELKQLSVSRLGKQVFDLEDVTAGYEGHPVVRDLSWLIGPGERIGILGANGAGKSTLLKLILGDIEPMSGTLKRGKSVRLGKMSQHLDTFDKKGHWRVSDYLAQYKSTYTIGGKSYTASSLLESLGFEPKEQLTYLKDLSGGQRRRLAFLGVLLEEPNVLILDEPGNDLDTDMLAVMEDLLDGWPGTLLLVTHDRYLMERVTDDQFALLGGHLTHMPGGVDQFLHLLEASPQTAGPTIGSGIPADKSLPTAQEGSSRPEGQAAAQPALSNSERRDARRRFDAIGRKLEKLRTQPDGLRAQMAAADATDYQALESLQQQLDECLDTIGQLEDQWLDLAFALGIDV